MPNPGDWLNLCAWDVVGQIIFSEPIGYLSHGNDFNGLLGITNRALDYFCLIGQIPWLDYWCDEVWQESHLPDRAPGFNAAVNLSVGHMVQRLQGIYPRGYNPRTSDFLDRSIEAKKSHPEVVDDGQIMSCLMINILAGADTTAITIRSVLYFILRNPEIWARVQAEVGRRSDEISFKEAHGMSYLNACVRESMRMHPPVAMILERFVPEGGLILPDGTTVPPGTAVGMNPYIISRNPFCIWR